jgi:hypothetical protein
LTSGRLSRMPLTSASNVSGDGKTLSAFQVWFFLTLARGRGIGMMVLLVFSQVYTKIKTSEA